MNSQNLEEKEVGLTLLEQRCQGVKGEPGWYDGGTKTEVWFMQDDEPSRSNGSGESKRMS